MVIQAARGDSRVWAVPNSGREQRYTIWLVDFVFCLFPFKTKKRERDTGTEGLISLLVTLTDSTMCDNISTLEARLVFLRL